MVEDQILIYNVDGNIFVDVMIEGDSVWLNIEQMALLFGKSRSTINEHILNIFEEGELLETNVLQKIGNTDFQQKQINYYNLDMVLAVGYRVRSKQGILFRNWASERLKEYLIQGFSLNEKKLKSGKPTEYFDRLQEKLREIRLSERLFYQKIKDIYTTSIDYDPSDEKTIAFFKVIQNKLLWAISEETAAELVYHRVDAELPFVGMQSYDKKSEKEITKKDVSVAKNYLNEEEIKVLGLLVEQYLAFAESMAQAQIPMKMSDRIERLDVILELNKKNILTHAGTISHKLAMEKADIEYGKFKDKQRLLEKKESMEELVEDIKMLI
ncbi:MAG TPA: RhuM family protein, partial [Candidatus Absconditabacterales bacterium]|nr:RhuM family protein [Candidatus Absconditabacterales bacterium]